MAPRNTCKQTVFYFLKLLQCSFFKKVFFTFTPALFEQEQTMFDDLRRGFTEDFHGLTKFERTFKDCQRSPKKAKKK